MTESSLFVRVNENTHIPITSSSVNLDHFVITNVAPFWCRIEKIVRMHPDVKRVRPRSSVCVRLRPCASVCVRWWVGGDLITPCHAMRDIVRKSEIGVQIT